MKYLVIAALMCAPAAAGTANVSGHGNITKVIENTQFVSPAQTASQTQSQTQNNSQGIVQNSKANIPVATAVAPTIVGAGFCAPQPRAGAIQTQWVGISLGNTEKSKLTEFCLLQAKASTAQALGSQVTARRLLCMDPDVRAAAAPGFCDNSIDKPKAVKHTHKPECKH